MADVDEVDWDARVQAGIAALDEYGPKDWRQRIIAVGPLTAEDMRSSVPFRSGCGCALARSYGMPYWQAIDLFDKARGVAKYDEARFGFNLGDEVADLYYQDDDIEDWETPYWRALANAWNRALGLPEVTE